jgi:hypothetical protein
MESVDSEECFELLEDGSVIEDDAASLMSSVMSSRSIMRMTEAFMDELCVSVENDLLGKDESYKDVIRDYREQKRSGCPIGSNYDTEEEEEEETILSSSFGTCSDDDIESLRLELYQGGRTKAILQALFLGVLPYRKKQSTKEPSDHISSLEPTYNSGLDANLDSVEVGSVQEDPEKKFPDKSEGTYQDNDKASGKNIPADGSVASIEAATDESSAPRQRSESVQHSDNVAVNNAVSQSENIDQSELSILQNKFIDVADSDSQQNDLSVTSLRRQTTIENLPGQALSTNILSNHLKQRRAIYLWSISVLRQRLQEKQEFMRLHGDEIQTLLNPTHKPQTIPEYDQTIIRALSLSMSMSQDSVEAINENALESEETTGIPSKFGTTTMTMEDQAKKRSKHRPKMALTSLLLRNNIEKSTTSRESGPQQAQVRDCHQSQQHCPTMSFTTPRKSLHLIQKEAQMDALQLAKQWKKRAFKLHSTSSVLKLQSSKKSAHDVILQPDPSEEDGVLDRDESMEIVEPLSTEIKRIGWLQRVLQWKVTHKPKCQKDRARDWVAPERLSLAFSSRKDSSQSLDKEETVMYCVDLSDSEAIDEEMSGFELTA